MSTSSEQGLGGRGNEKIRENKKRKWTRSSTSVKRSTLSNAEKVKRTRGDRGDIRTWTKAGVLRAAGVGFIGGGSSVLVF